MTTSADQSPTVREGELLAGKYRVERVLGQGAMGVVVAALHVPLQARVAIKFLLPSVMANAELVARFLREAQSAVKIKSEHVAHVLDIGTLDDGRPYMVMEMLTGADLSQSIHTRGAFPIDEAIDCILQACDAIAEAHALGIVHRDLKPSNLFLTQTMSGAPLVKVLDFGISKVMTSGPSSVAQMSLTATTAVMGSPLYMSPEQIRSVKNVDGRSDVWSLGVILYELLAGETPFVCDTMSGLLAAIIADPPSSIRTKRVDIPKALEAVLTRCLEKDVSRRVQSVAELAQLLAPFAPRRSAPVVERILSIAAAVRAPRSDEGACPAVGSEQIATRVDAGTLHAWGQRTQTHGKKPKIALWIALSMGALMMPAGVWVGVHRHRSPALVTPQTGMAAAVGSSTTGAAATLPVAPSEGGSAVVSLPRSGPTAAAEGAAEPANTEPEKAISPKALKSSTLRSSSGGKAKRVVFGKETNNRR